MKPFNWTKKPFWQLSQSHCELQVNMLLEYGKGLSVVFKIGQNSNSYHIFQILNPEREIPWSCIQFLFHFLCIFIDSLVVNSEPGRHRFLNVLTPQIIQLGRTIHFVSFTLPDAFPLEQAWGTFFVWVERKKKYSPRALANEGWGENRVYPQSWLTLLGA